MSLEQLFCDTQGNEIRSHGHDMTPDWYDTHKHKTTHFFTAIAWAGRRLLAGARAFFAGVPAKQSYVEGASCKSDNLGTNENQATIQCGGSPILKDKPRSTPRIQERFLPFRPSLAAETSPIPHKVGEAAP